MHWFELIPEELLQAHEDGNVVFFCGAGVSVPAGLPSFKGLVEIVLQKMLPANARRTGTDEAPAWCAFCEGRYDEALDILENPRAGNYEPQQVRQEIRNRLQKRRRDLDKHLILTRLADLDKESGRLVTTNFDHLFEKAVRKLCRQEGSKHRLTRHIAPALPPAKRETFRGLAYLHGKLGSSQDDLQLVLTESDFSRAYLLEGWARRFAVDLFRHYRVVFIGYRAEDPMMRSLVRTLDVAREESPQQFKQPYAFAKKSKKVTVDERKWRLKGIEPLLYDAADKPDEHQELWRVLKEWADDYRQERTERREKIARLGQHPPKDKNDIQYMAWRLKDIEIARHFADSKAHPGWIAPLQREGLLSLPIGQTDNGESIAVPLVSQRLTDYLALHDATFHLSRWIVECLDTQEAIDWVLRGGGVLHTDLRQQIRFQLDKDKTEPRPAVRKIWQVLADDGYAHMLSEKRQIYSDWLSLPYLSPDAVFAKRVFLNHLRPLPVFKVDQGFKAIFENLRNEPTGPQRLSDWCEIELIGIRENFEDVDRFRDSAEDWAGTLAAMADELTALLLEAMDWFREFDKAAPDRDITYSEYPSISPHEQNRSPPTWAQLIELTRDSYDALVAAGNQDAAGHLARGWRSLPYPVFRRLALYAATGAGTHDVKLGLDVLLEEPQPALWDIHTQRETLRFLRKRGNDIPKESLVRLIEKILEGPPLSPTPQVFSDGEWNEVRDQDIRLRLHKLIECGINLPSKAQEVYDRIQRDMPWEPGGDHSEEFVFFTSAACFFDPNEIAAPQDFADMPVQEFIRWAETQPGGYWEFSRDWWRFVEEDVESAVNLLKAASSKEIWPIPPWYKILEVLKEKEEKQDKQGTVDDALKRKVAGLIIAMPEEKLAELDFPASKWLGEVRTKLSEKMRRALWGAIWDASLMGEPPEGRLDYDGKAINYAGGILGEILWKELTDIIPKVSAGENPGFPEPLRPDFERIAENNQPAGKLARANLAPYLIWLYRIDPDWTKRAFFRRMDIDDGKAFDPYLWEGYLWNPRCTADLLAACKFRQLFFKILRNIDRLRESVRDSVCSHGVILFIHMAVPPGRGIDTEEAKGVLWNVGIEGLTKAAWTLRDMLDGAGEKSGVLWRDTIGPWFAKAWPKRRQDRSPELSAHLAWMAMESGDAFPQAVAAIEDLLTPEKHSASLSRLMEKKDIIERYPDDVLTLVAGLVDDNSGVWNLREVLECIAEAKPGLKEDHRFQRLDART